jgi:3',5'-cyclic AMP phosphodiesterase CpdA
VRVCPECGFSLGTSLGEGPLELTAPLPTGGFRLAHLSDLHLADTPQGQERLAVFERWLGALARCHVDGLVVTGDLSEVPDRTRFRMAWVLLRDSGLRWAVIPGNHDVEIPGKPGAFSEVFGEYPRVERWGRVELVLLDSNAGLAVEDRGTLEGSMGWLKCFTEGRVGQEQLGRVEPQLREVAGQARVLLLHHHLSPQHAERLVPLVDDTVLGTMGVLKDADAVRCWAMEHHVALVLHGHKHAMLRTGMLGGEILVLNGGSSTQPPRPRARLVDFLEGNHRRVVEVELT